MTAPSLRAGLPIAATAGLLSGSCAPQARAPVSSGGRPQEALPDRLASPTDSSADLCPTPPSSPTQTRDAARRLPLPPAAPAASPLRSRTGQPRSAAPASWGGPRRTELARQRACSPPPGACPRLQSPPPLCYLHPQPAPQCLCPGPGACLWGAHRRPAGARAALGVGLWNPTAVQPDGRRAPSLVTRRATSPACCSPPVGGGTPASRPPVPGAVGAIVSQAGGVCFQPDSPPPTRGEGQAGLWLHGVARAADGQLWACRLPRT